MGLTLKTLAYGLLHGIPCIIVCHIMPSVASVFRCSWTI